MTYVLGKVDASRGPGYKLAKEFGQQLLENCKEVVGTAPLYKDGMHSVSTLRPTV
jgi:hypothetical protein